VVRVRISQRRANKNTEPRRDTAPSKGQQRPCPTANPSFTPLGSSRFRITKKCPHFYRKKKKKCPTLVQILYHGPPCYVSIRSWSLMNSSAAPSAASTSRALNGSAPVIKVRPECLLRSARCRTRNCCWAPSGESRDLGRRGEEQYY
jgi:hypothetical protein